MWDGEARELARIRADRLLVARGLFATRSAAQAAIAAGLVRADGAAVDKPAELLNADAALEAVPAHPWASRAGVKLTHALDWFEVNPAGRICLDLGASAGGFTDVLLARGAALVIAVDVGRGQLQPRLQAEPRVRSYESLDARALQREHVPPDTSLVVADISFIGLAKAAPAALALAAPAMELLALVKPQFESGPDEGLKRDRRGNLDEDAARAVAERAAQGLEGLGGLTLRGLIESPVVGGGGAREWLAYAARP